MQSMSRVGDDAERLRAMRMKREWGAASYVEGPRW
jgi:hypothetical protein